MDCKKIKQKLSAYLDNELNPQEKPDLSEHLKTCQACREELAILTKQDIFLKKPERIEPLPYFRTRLQTRLSESNKKEYTNPVFKWIPIPLTCSVLIILFFVFSALTPAIYGIADVEIKSKISMLFRKNISCVNTKNVIAPLNFIAFYNEYCQILCECCQQKDGSVCICGRCEK